MAMDKNLELVKRIKNGDEKSYEILLMNHKNMIYKIINTADIYRGDYIADTESLFQEGSIALYNAVFTFEENKGMCFTSYAYMIIRSRINTYLRDDRSFLDDMCSIDNNPCIDYHISMSNLCIAENPITYHKELEFEETLNKFVDNLNSEDRQIFEMRSNDLSYKQISERLKINTKRVDNRLRLLRRRLKKYLEENE